VKDGTVIMRELWPHLPKHKEYGKLVQSLFLSFQNRWADYNFTVDTGSKSASKMYKLMSKFKFKITQPWKAHWTITGTIPTFDTAVFDDIMKTGILKPSGTAETEKDWLASLPRGPITEEQDVLKRFILYTNYIMELLLRIDKLEEGLVISTDNEKCPEETWGKWFLHLYDIQHLIVINTAKDFLVKDAEMRNILRKEVNSFKLGNDRLAKGIAKCKPSEEAKYAVHRGDDTDPAPHEQLYAYFIRELFVKHKDAKKNWFIYKESLKKIEAAVDELSLIIDSVESASNIKKPTLEESSPRIYVPLSVAGKQSEVMLINEMIRIQDATADGIHFDVRDANYFKNSSRPNANTAYPDNTKDFTPELINAAKEAGIQIPFDIHLLYWEPDESYIRSFAETGIVKSVDIQHDAFSTKNKLLKTLKYIKSLNIKAGLVIEEDENIEDINEAVLKEADLVIITAVPTGKLGGVTDIRVLDKIEALRKRKFSKDIMIQGGIDDKTVRSAYEMDATLFVSGSYVLNNKEGLTPKEAMETLRISTKEVDFNYSMMELKATTRRKVPDTTFKIQKTRQSLILYADDILENAAVIDLEDTLREMRNVLKGGKIVLFARRPENATILEKIIKRADPELKTIVVTPKDLHNGENINGNDEKEIKELIKFAKRKEANEILAVIKGRPKEPERLNGFKIPIVLVGCYGDAIYSFRSAIIRAVKAKQEEGKDGWIIMLPPVGTLSGELEEKYNEYKKTLKALQSA